MSEAVDKKRKLRIALTGNPNCGKTTVFNALTSSHQHVGNWPGVTVEKVVGKRYYNEAEMEIIDLPGTYSLTAFSADEIVARDFILNEKPDVVVHVVDASNLERSLYLTTQLMELGVRIVIALNMIDLSEKSGDEINSKIMAEFLEIPVVETIAKIGYGVNKLADEIYMEATKPEHHEHKIGYGEDTEEKIVRLESLLKMDKVFIGDYPVRWIAVKLIEGDKEVRTNLGKSRINREVDNYLSSLDTEELEAEMSDKRFEAIDSVLSQSLKKASPVMTQSDMMDRVITNKYLGIPIFLILIWGAFELTFNVAEPFIRLIDMGFSYLSQWSVENIQPEWLGSLVGEGIFGGVGFVLTFIPNILMLFFVLSLLEESGYMSRAAFILDRIMYKLGLNGKSIIPLIMGFGCNIPGIMATRTIENDKDRLITILISPFMSCGARLPVFMLFAGAFFAGMASLVIFSLYILGITVAILSVKIFRATLLPGKPSQFLMELPPYQMPSLKNSVLHMWEHGSEYLKKAGTLIFVFSIILWSMASFGSEGYLEESEKEIGEGESLKGVGFFQGNGTFYIPEDAETGKFTGTFHKTTNLSSGRYEKGEHYQNITLKEGEEIAGHGKYIGECEFTSTEKNGSYRGSTYTVEESFAADLGHVFVPITTPLGFNWKINTALVFGFVAKEVVIGSIGILYGVGEDDSAADEAVKENEDFSPLIALCLMIFTLLYLPCVATIPVIYQETKSARWTIFSVLYGLTVAYIVTLVVYQVGTLIGY